jgi:hypothetical protein
MGYLNIIVPIVFIIYKRPEQTMRVFQAIREAKPTKLYVIADGPKNNDDLKKCLETRKILDFIDWECIVKNNYSETNLGLKKRIVSGLDWVFEQEEMAIILEDDCLPDLSFFYYCEELLEKYKNDQRIGIISGNLFLNKIGTNCSYYFSNFPHIWGWATWKRTWDNYDGSIKEWPQFRSLSWLAEFTGSEYYARIWQELLDKVHQQEIDTWDYQIAFMLWKQNQLSIVPNCNLVSNIGFGEDSTHTNNASDRFSLLPTIKMDFPLSHPKVICHDHENDLLEAQVIFGSTKALTYFLRVLKIFKGY